MTRDAAVLALAAVLVAVSLTGSTCEARAQPWTAEEGRLGADADLWLARSFVAEGPPADWPVIAHVLRRRWAAARGQWPRQTFVGTIRAYCAGLDTPRTSRQRWIHALTREDARRRPAGFPASSWTRFRDGPWRAARALAASFVSDPSSVPDPCPEAAHWGSLSDAVAWERRHPGSRRVCEPAGGWRQGRNVTWAREPRR